MNREYPWNRNWRFCDRHLYVLELAGGKFYVGQAKDPDRRIRKHFNGSGSQWTRMHRPVREVSRELLAGVDYRAGEIAENTLVVQLMRLHGYQNVRGGFFTSISAEMVVKGLISHGYEEAFQLLDTSVEKLEGLSMGVVDLVNPVIPSEHSVFVLRLEGEKFFVGYSTNPTTRIARHFSGKASDWTAFYKPAEVLFTRSLGSITTSAAAAKTAEATVALMRLAGWKNVRGGPWNRMDNAEIAKLLNAHGYHDVPAERPC